MQWVQDQIYNLSILEVVFTVMFSTGLSRLNLNKQLKAIHQEIYENTEELKDEIREKIAAK